MHNAFWFKEHVFCAGQSNSFCAQRDGLSRIAEILKGLSDWGDAREYASVDELRGILSLRSYPNAQAFERANYMKALIHFTRE